MISKGEDDLALRELKLIKQQYTNSKNVISDTQKIIPTLAIGWRGDDYEKEKEKNRKFVFLAG